MPVSERIVINIPEEGIEELGVLKLNLIDETNIPVLGIEGWMRLLWREFGLTNIPELGTEEKRALQP